MTGKDIDQMWNTGCNNIGNGLAVGINILDGEDQSLAITVPSHGSHDWQSVIFPWCVDSNEIRRKAFRVTNIVTGRVFLYLFQDYHTNRICWSLATATDPWKERTVIKSGLESDSAQVPHPALDIFIMADKVWGLAAKSENHVFQDVFNGVLGVASAVGSIAGAIGA